MGTQWHFYGFKSLNVPINFQGTEYLWVLNGKMMFAFGGHGDGGNCNYSAYFTLKQMY